MTLPAHVHIAVIGAGFAGVGAAVRLLPAGHRDLAVLERAADVGGVWRDNSYPGCACDVPSSLYSFSFAPHPGWTTGYGRQPEIHDYLRQVVRDHGVEPYVHTGCDLRAARWDAEQQRWHLRTSRGDLTADVLIAATGGLSEPSVPDLPGLDRFAGTAFHSAQWDHDHDLTGRRVAVIGTGASAVQFVPYVQEAAAALTLFQRTPPWVLPRREGRVPAWRRSLYRRVPLAQRAVRGLLYARNESFALGFTVWPRLLAPAERLSRALIAHQIHDPELRARVTPHYRAGCKRLLFSSRYYRALAADNVDVVVDRIVEVTGTAIVTAGPDGSRTEHRADTIIFGTGFAATDPPLAGRLTGSDGWTLAEHWASSGMQALHGTTVAGFPNLFLLMGPNTGLGHNSVLYMIESQLTYVLDALRVLAEQGLRSVEARRSAQDRWTSTVARRLGRTVWETGGCASWYRDAQGRNTTLWPAFTFQFRRRLRRFPLDSYVSRPAPGRGL